MQARSELRDLFDAGAHEYDGYMERGGNVNPQAELVRMIMKENIMGGMILDVGTATGGIPAHVADNTTSIVVGMDFSKIMLKIAVAKNDHKPGRRLFLLGDMDCQFPFKDKAFDSVISSFTIGYAADLGGLLYEMQRVCKSSLIFITKRVVKEPGSEEHGEIRKKWRSWSLDDMEPHLSKHNFNHYKNFEFKTPVAAFIAHVFTRKI